MFTIVFLVIYCIRVLEYVRLLNYVFDELYDHRQRCQMTKEFIIREIKYVVAPLLFDALIIGSLFCRDF